MSITLATAIKQTPIFNLYLEETGKIDPATNYAESYRLVMPDPEIGTFPDNVLRRKTGLVIAWPVNPHDSGETSILSLLCANGLNVSCVGYAKDQNGRWFKRR